ncbi:hypothetical protein CsSME_00017627 [Camellia sinensis var. sinensis]
MVMIFFILSIALSILSFMAFSCLCSSVLCNETIHMVTIWMKQLFDDISDTNVTMPHTHSDI